MKPEHKKMDESASVDAIRWAIVAIIILAIGVLTYSFIAEHESLGTATTEVVPQYPQLQPASDQDDGRDGWCGAGNCQRELDGRRRW